MDDGHTGRPTNSRGRRAIVVVGALLLLIVMFTAIVDANSVALLVWGTDPSPFPPTL